MGSEMCIRDRPIQAKVIDKNKAFNLCKSEVKSEFIGATRYRLRGIKDRGAGFKIQFMLYYPEGNQKVLCELDRYSGTKKLTEL